MDIDLRRVDGDDHRDGMKVGQADPRPVQDLHPAAGCRSTPAPNDQIDADVVSALDDLLLRDGRTIAAPGNPGDRQTRRGQEARTIGRIEPPHPLWADREDNRTSGDRPGRLDRRRRHHRGRRLLRG
jgi:hypothetical protein